MKGQRIGYVRVSTFDQNVDRQLDGQSLDRIFTDKASGKDINRPELDAMLAFAGLTRDDVEVVTFPTYAATMASLSENKADVTCTVTATGPVMVAGCACASTQTRNVRQTSKSERPSRRIGVPPRSRKCAAETLP